MRLLGFLPDDRLAQRFVDYMLTQGIPMHLEEGERGWAVWVEHDDHLERARQELEAYAQDPEDPRYDAAPQANRLRLEEERKQRRLRKQYVDVRTSWAAAGDRARPLTLVLVLLSIVVAVATRLGYTPAGADNTVLGWLLISEYIFDPVVPWFQRLPEIASGQVWRLITPIFIHFGPIHLLFNMFWLWDLGGIIEARRGTLRLGLLVLMAAIIPNLMQFYWENSPLFGGMSGVVYALFGYAWMQGRFQPQRGIVLNPNVVYIMVGWLFLGGLLVGNIAHAAHGGGLVVGMVAGAAPYFIQRWRRR